MNSFRRVAVAAAGALLVAGPGLLQAHHSVSGVFDTNHNQTATGVLTKVELINPHSQMHFDIKNAAGQVESWSFETGTPAALKVMGVSVRDTFKLHQTYKLVYSPARSKSAGNIGLLSSVVLPDGRVVAFGGKNNTDAYREDLQKKQ
jgi:hypothetical protein